MATQLGPLRLGAPVCFDDRWHGHVGSLDVRDDWEVLNLTVTAGFIATKSVKLPFNIVTSWSDGMVRIAAESARAFAREIPPIAVAAHTLTSRTATSHPGTRFAGLTVRTTDRRAEEVLLSRGDLYRVEIGQVRLEDESLTLSLAPENIVRYYRDAEIEENVRKLIRDDPYLMPDDRSELDVDAVSGDLVLTGNVRVDTTKYHIEQVAQQVPGAVTVRNEIMDDFAIEVAIGLALERAGLYHEAQVAVRSSLGIVTLFGSAPSSRAIEDIVLATQKLPGVRGVVSQLRVQAPALR